MLDLGGHHTQSQYMLQLKDAPGFARDDLVMTDAKHKQVGQHRDANGFFTAVLVPTDLVLAQAQTRFEFPVQQLNGMITNDKFCCTRWSQLQLSWWRRPLRLRS